jgi:hypothetical protein
MAGDAHSTALIVEVGGPMRAFLGAMGTDELRM